jgi:hypothetical protein
MACTKVTKCFSLEIKERGEESKFILGKSLGDGVLLW